MASQGHRSCDTYSWLAMPAVRAEVVNYDICTVVHSK